MKKLSTNLFFITLLFVGLFVTNLPKPLWADEDESGPGVTNEVKNRTKQENKNSVDNSKNKRKEARTEVKNNLKNREKLKQRTEERKEEIKTRVGEKREELKLKNKIDKKREELKKNLGKIKDEKKGQALEKIDQQIDELNRRLLDHYLNMSNKLSDVLIKISKRADKAEERGIDVSTVRAAIDKADSAIEATKIEIENQAGKTYTIQVTTEESLKTDVGRTRQALHSDLASVREVVKAAHELVRSAATTLAQLPKPTTTPKSETTTPTP